MFLSMIYKILRKGVYIKLLEGKGDFDFGCKNLALL